ncbi:ribonuclease HII [Thioalkalicoccus limnaeus]|uniref:Ribonuclease HII n=1 Tax=Thioalkalicoccus limnaeus TaxID=120681 RepID=A0ABV4BEE2_9GAMM
MSGPPLVAGVDEAGRGPLAGPVVAAAVILDPARLPQGLADSKRLTAARRGALERVIQSQALAWGLGLATVAEIDEHNILNASLLAMQRAVAGLSTRPTLVLIDGNRCPVLSYPAEAVVGGDALVPAISAASILAKVVRDRIMERLDRQHPGYGFAIHKGYPTRAHREALARLGPCAIHRRTFGPVREGLARAASSAATAVPG